MLSGMQSLMVAYLAVWVIFFGYQFSIGRRLRQLQNEVERLKASGKRQ
jgi:CcmD family protein